MFGGADAFDASQGADLLGLALGQGEPGSAGLDEFVEFEVYFDGARSVAERGEAVPYLRARICQAFEILDAGLRRYLWHRDRFVLEVDLGEEQGDEPRLVGHLRTGDGAEDEWFVVHLLRQLSSTCSDVSCRVFDSDGELLLIEAALAAPRWLSPANAQHRCWIRGGLVHILPRPRPPEPEQLPLREALAKLRSAQGSSVAKDAVQQAISARLEGYPKRAIELSTHVARAILPVPVARVLAAYPQLVAVALDHLPPPPTKELVRLRRTLEGEEANVHFDCDGPAEQETTCIGVRLTRCHYAWLMGLKCQLPQRFTQKHWRPPPAASGTAVDDKAMQLGAKLCAGLEAAFLQGTKSATAALRWPSPRLDQAALLPAALPWSPDATFARHAAGLQPAPALASAASRRAFLQQSELDEPFRPSFLRALAASKAVNLSDFWRDTNDAEDWLEVSAEELDREMMARQAEFDAYDRASAARGSKESRRAASEADDLKAEKLQQDVAALGKELSGLLTRDSCLDGVDVGRRDAASGSGSAAGATASRGNAPGGDQSDSDDSDSEELDVLGLEEEGEGETSSEDEGDGPAGKDHGGSLHTYMAELDEQLESELDGKTPDADGAGEGLANDTLPLSSHHIKVHHTGPMELDMHAMEHVLASYCSEHQLSPGPASLLLGELGLASQAVAGGIGRAAPAPTGAANAEPCLLSAMD